jgi:hypothetical protein
VRHLLAVNSRHYADACTAMLLAAEARRYRRASPAEARHWAELAAIAAERSTGPCAADARAEAWAELGNAHRLVGEWDHAAAALARAEAEAGLGSGDPVLRGEVASLRASLALALEAPDEAAWHLAGALPGVQAAGEMGLAVRMLVQLAIACEISGDPVAGIDALAGAWAILPADTAGALRVSLAHETVYALLASGRPDEALALYHDVQPTYRLHGSDVECARGRWVAGRAMGEIGAIDEAAEMLLSAREVLERQGRASEVGAILLDQAVVELHRDARAARQLATEALPLLTALRLPVTTLAALRAAIAAEGAQTLGLALAQVQREGRSPARLGDRQPLGSE